MRFLHKRGKPAAPVADGPSFDIEMPKDWDKMTDAEKDAFCMKAAQGYVAEDRKTRKAK